MSERLQRILAAVEELPSTRLTRSRWTVEKLIHEKLVVKNPKWKPSNTVAYLTSLGEIEPENAKHCLAAINTHMLRKKNKPKTNL